MNIQIAGGLNLGAASLSWNLPNRQNLSVLHLLSSTYKTTVTSPTMANLAYLGAPASQITGSPTFDTAGMTVNALGDGLVTSAFDVGGDLTAFVLAEVLDTCQAIGTDPIFLTSYNQDGSGIISGAKGMSFGIAPNTGNRATLSTISRASNVATVVLSAAPGTPFTTGQYVTVAGVLADLTLNGLVGPITSLSATSYTFASLGANLGTTAASGASCWNGQSQLQLKDTCNVVTNTQSIVSISRNTNVVTMVTGPAITGLTAGSPVTVAGVTGDTSFNGTYTAVSVSGATITYNCTGTAGSGTVTSATAGLATNYQTVLAQTETVLNTPRFLAVTISAASGVRTMYDFSSGGFVATQTTASAGRDEPVSPQNFLFGTSYFNSVFGRFKGFAFGLHVGYCMPQAQLLQNYQAIQAKLGIG